MYLTIIIHQELDSGACKPDSFCATPSSRARGKGTPFVFPLLFPKATGLRSSFRVSCYSGQ